MQVFVRNCTHILTKTQGEKSEDMFLVKKANKGTSLSRLFTIKIDVFPFLQVLIPTVVFFHESDH